MRVLVIDDEKEICEIVRLFLTPKGFEVLTAISGDEGLGLLEKEKVDLIILDKKMYGMSGEEVYGEIRKRGINVPVIIMTGSRRLPGYEDSDAKQGYADILFKPVDLDDLVTSVEKALANNKK